LSAAVLKVINSPFFGLSSKSVRFPTRSDAGMKNVKCISTGLMLKTALGGGEALMLERFWDASEKNADIDLSCSTLPNVPRDETYTSAVSGMRHSAADAAFSGLQGTLKIAAGLDEPMPVIEDKRMAPIMRGRLHGGEDLGVVRNDLRGDLAASDLTFFCRRRFRAAGAHLVSINFIAEYLNDEILRMRDNPAWRVVGDAVLDHLGIGAGSSRNYARMSVPLCGSKALPTLTSRAKYPASGDRRISP